MGYPGNPGQLGGDRWRSMRRCGLCGYRGHDRRTCTAKRYCGECGAFMACDTGHPTRCGECFGRWVDHIQCTPSVHHHHYRPEPEPEPEPQPTIFETLGWRSGLRNILTQTGRNRELWDQITSGFSVVDHLKKSDGLTPDEVELFDALKFIESYISRCP